MRIIDTHCHINISEFKDDAHDVIQTALDKGIYLIAPGTQNSTSERAVEYAHQHENVWAAVGLHPTQLFDMKAHDDEAVYYSRAEEFNYQYYKNLAHDKEVVAIGEVGLDYYHMPEGVSIEALREKQIDILLQQFALAEELALPLIIHTRNGSSAYDCFADVLQLIDDTGYSRCVMHSYAGSLEYARKFIERGCMISFSGVITFKNATNIHMLVRSLPLEHLMIETDSPYIAPEPHRGTRNEPANIVFIAERIAELQQVSMETVIRQTAENAKKFFNLPI